MVWRKTGGVLGHNLLYHYPDPQNNNQKHDPDPDWGGWDRVLLRSMCVKDWVVILRFGVPALLSMTLS